jgi:hypothetical protein
MDDLPLRNASVHLVVAHGALQFSPAEAAAWKTQDAEWAEYFSDATPAPGLPAKYTREPGALRDLNSYFAWAA